MDKDKLLATAYSLVFGLLTAAMTGLLDAVYQHAATGELDPLRIRQTAIVGAIAGVMGYWKTRFGQKCPACGCDLSKPQQGK